MTCRFVCHMGQRRERGRPPRGVVHPERLRAHAAGRRGCDGPPPQAGSHFQRSIATSYLVLSQQYRILAAGLAPVSEESDAAAFLAG